VTPLASDGQLGGAVVARPGTIKFRGRVEKITGRSVRGPRGPNGGVGAEQSCSDADVQPSPDNLGHISDVIFCLMNAMRAGAGVPPLREQDQLAQASAGHSQDMVDHKYFAHDSQDGGDVVARLTDVGYIPATGEWVVGENLAWGSGVLASPAALVNAWMNSPPHRENLLSPDFSEVGMGVVYGTPSSDASDGVTVTTDFGTRSGAAAAPTAATAKPASPAATPRAAAAARRRNRALRRCTKRHGVAKRRCVRAARRIR
jgi:uncharacterized protein YkwD